MRDKIIALAMCALLAVSLFACGEKRGTSNDSDILGDEQQYGSGTNSGTNGTNNGGMTGNGTNNGTNSGTNNSTNNGNTGSSNGSISSDTNGNNGTNGNNADQSDVMGDSAQRGSTINPANGGADRTATWEQMLDNGRVHDRDGFLFDGENSHWA